MSEWNKKVQQQKLKNLKLEEETLQVIIQKNNVYLENAIFDKAALELTRKYWKERYQASAEKSPSYLSTLIELEKMKSNCTHEYLREWCDKEIERYKKLYEESQARTPLV